MEKKIPVTLLVCLIGIFPAYSQWSKQDSINLHKILSAEGDIKLNEEAIRSIHFGMPKEQLPDMQPLMSIEKPSLKFRNDLPTLFTDSVAKYRARLTLIPYNISTKYNEDPIHMPNNAFTQRLKASMNLNKPFDIRNTRTSAGPHSDNPTGTGISVPMDFNHILSYWFSKKYRTRAKNAERANAWKTY